MIKSSRKLLSCLAGMMLALVANAEPVALKDNHPERYTVVSGDTLWDIASTFLRDPWRWPDIWQVNPQIANPHLIYPGDVLELTYVNGEPRLSLQRGGPVKLSPQVRSTPLDAAIPTIPIDAIKQFLTRPYVLNEGEGDAAPYVVAFADEHIVGGAGQRFYARTVDTDEKSKFDVVRPGDAYRDAETDEILGYEALYVGSSQLQRTGDPATLQLTGTTQEVVIGDRLLPTDQDTALVNFHPKPPVQQVRGSIIRVFGGVSQIGQYNVVVIDRGTQDGMQVGDVLQIDQRGETIRDVVSPERRDTVTLPDEKAGKLMVFRTFDRVSFGLVMEASRAIHLLDRVHNP